MRRIKLIFAFGAVDRVDGNELVDMFFKEQIIIEFAHLEHAIQFES